MRALYIIADFIELFVSNGQYNAAGRCLVQHYDCYTLQRYILYTRII